MADLIHKLKHGGGHIKEGSALKSGILLKENNPEQGTIKLGDLVGRNLIIGIPGAFTPPCSSHVPGYVQHYDAFVQKGIKDIYVVAVNDAFVTMAWKEKLGASASQVHFLADDDGSFTSEVGMLFDAKGLLGNKRSKRYVLVVDDGIVKHVFVESEVANVEVTKAENVLGKI
ncbi:Redoxin [Tilletiaria anomala UBC 951]|uniref:Redoxin n=1 Tax=Tilletiaria anomala (strain ATCC 24038 / CBS 436.72 / UBC 951) TaxID=1037660 RepID=A0A066W200_TILAU|nr:Redoxin [Tilletiaria anomala UBC 951]KDN45109.1 Redoxin [Tilletiaria anomala UBC 951]